MRAELLGHVHACTPFRMPIRARGELGLLDLARHAKVFIIAIVGAF